MLNITDSRDLAKAKDEIEDLKLDWLMERLLVAILEFSEDEAQKILKEV